MSKIDLKVVLLGKQFGGKTSLAERYLHDRFTGDSVPYQNTIGAAFGAKKVNIYNQQITLGIWDTAGSERYESMSRIYYRSAGAAVICYDLTDDASFEKVRFWVTELKKHEQNCCLYLCGTKKDLIAIDKSYRKVDYHLTTDYADEIHASLFETSSKTGEAVDELFQKIAEDYVRSHPKYVERPTSLSLLNEEPLKKQSCCLTAQ